MKLRIHKLLDQIGIPKFLAELAERADLNDINLPTHCRMIRTRQIFENSLETDSAEKCCFSYFNDFSKNLNLNRLISIN